MNPRSRLPRGVTLMELLVYLGISSFIVVALTSYLMNATRQRVLAMDQTIAQENARAVFAKMTYALRNSYAVAVSETPERVEITAENPGHPGQPIITVFQYNPLIQSVEYGQAIGTPPIAFQPLTDPAVTVRDLDFEGVSSAVIVRGTFLRGTREAHVESTIAYRQGI